MKGRLFLTMTTLAALAFAASVVTAGPPVQDPAALAKLSEPERQTWQAFWQEVEGVLRGPAPAP